MDRKRMAELSGIPGMAEHVLQEVDTDFVVDRFPEVTQVSGLSLTIPDAERPLKDIPLPALTLNTDRVAFKLGNLGVLTLDAQGTVWRIYLSPQASDVQVRAAVEMARKALIPDEQRAKADALSGYRGESAEGSPSRRIGRILTAEFRQGGYDKMMKVAFQIEAGTVLPGLANAKEWLAGTLQDIRQGSYPDIRLSKNELSRLMMYRDDLRFSK